MKCPHCSVAMHVDSEAFELKDEGDNIWLIDAIACPACNLPIIHLEYEGNAMSSDTVRVAFGKRTLIYPKTFSRPLCPPEVPKEIAQEYKEACVILADSPMTSAALSRRCLQHFLRDVVKVKRTTCIKSYSKSLIIQKYQPT